MVSSLHPSVPLSLTPPFPSVQSSFHPSLRSSVTSFLPSPLISLPPSLLAPAAARDGLDSASPQTSWARLATGGPSQQSALSGSRSPLARGAAERAGLRYVYHQKEL